MNGWVIFGQILGIFGSALTVLSYQCKTPRMLLLLQTVSTALFVCNYWLIGASSGVLLNIVCIGRNLIYYNKDKKIFSYPFYPYLLAVILVVCCAFSWQGPVSLLITAALAVNTVFLSFGRQNLLRISIVFTCSLILLYNVFVFSPGGILNESFAIASSVVGLWRYRKEKI